jgi:hypothetical protein
VRENEGGWATLRFSSIRVREGDRRRHVTWRSGRMGGGGSSVLRKEKDLGWAGAGPQRPGGPER